MKFSLRPPVERKKEKRKKKKTSFALLRVSSDNTSLSPPSFCSQCFFLFKNVHVSILRRPSVLLPNFLLCSFLFIAPIDTRARTSTEHTYVFHATLSLSLEDFSPVLWFFFFSLFVKSFALFPVLCIRAGDEKFDSTDISPGLTFFVVETRKPATI